MLVKPKHCLAFEEVLSGSTRNATVKNVHTFSEILRFSVFCHSLHGLYSEQPHVYVGNAMVTIKVYLLGRFTIQNESTAASHK